MKFKGSKKIVSLFLAVLMVVSSVPAFAINASAAVNTSTDVSALKTAMTTYETKMTSGKIYTNMANAYTYYIAAQKAYDACVYGYNDAYVAKATTDLTNATNAMTEWTAPTFTASAYHMNNVATGAYKNVVYGPKGDTWWTPNDYNYDGGAFGVKVALSNNVVTCYDGTDTYIPIMLQCYSSQAFTLPGTRQIYKSIFSLSNSNVNYTAALNHNWRFVSNVTGDIWNSPESNQNLSYTSTNTAQNIPQSKSCSVYNRVFLTSNNNSTYYDTIDYSNFVTNSTFYGKYMFGSTNPTVTQSGAGTAYIINYEPIKVRISTLSAELAKYSVANYTQGGLKELLSAIDACTSVNPNSYGYESNVADAVKNCGDAIKAAMGKTYSVTPDDAKFQTLRDAIKDSQTATTDKTAVSLVEYGKAIKAGRDFFANLATYINNGDNAESLANAIKNKYNALVNVDTDDAYSNFDAAVTVVNAMDKDAFKNQDEVTNQINSAKAQVYTTLTDSADIEAYTLATGTAPTADLKNSTSVDTVTKDLLNFASNPDESLINHYTVSVGATVFNKGTETNLEAVDLGSKKYGEIVDINVNDLFSDVNNIADKTISWTVQYKNSNNETISNQKVRNDEPTISVKATANIVVTALVTDETKTEETTGYTVKFLDIYGKLADVAYTTDKPESGSFDMDSYTVGDKIYTPEIPFYTLKGFTVSSPDSNNVVTVRPTYTTEIRLGVTVYNGTAESSSLKSDSTVQKTKTVTVSTTVAHIGWAVVKDNKYQIVAYTDGDYQFVALGDDNSSLIYTPIIVQDGGYAVYNSDATTTALTASNVYQFENNSAVSKDKVSDDAYLNAKIAAKAPFTYVEEYTTLDVSGTTMYRYYVRITAGSDAQLIGFGVEADSKKYSLTSKNDLTGQYSASFRSAKSEFKAYVSYSFTYSYGGTDYNISTADYATL